MMPWGWRQVRKMHQSWERSQGSRQQAAGTACKARPENSAGCPWRRALGGSTGRKRLLLPAPSSCTNICPSLLGPSRCLDLHSLSAGCPVSHRLGWSCREGVLA